MSRFVPGRGFEPDPRGIDRNDPKALADYNRRREEFYNKPIQKDFFGRGTPRNDRGELLATTPGGPGGKPIRDRTYGRWQDQKLPGDRPIRDRTYGRWQDQKLPGDRAETHAWGREDDPRYAEKKQEWHARNRHEDKPDDRLYAGGPSPIRGVSGHDYLNNPKYRERSLPPGIRPGGPPSVRYAPGETPPAHHRKPNWWERPRTPSPRRGGEIGRGLDTDMDRLSLLTGQGSIGGGSLGADAERMRLLTGGSNFGTGPRPEPGPRPRPEPVPGPRPVPGPVPGPGPGWTPYDDSDLKKRIAALEERGSLVTQPTQDLSDIQKRLQDLEGRKPSWQEKRIKDLEGRQDDTSWKDSLALLETGQQTGKKARSALDTRLASLENYYKNDPPPKESVGNRYEDKYNQLNKLWERTGKAQKWGDAALKETGYKGRANWDYSYASDQGQAWAGDLPEGYIQGIRNLNREYNKPVHSAIIKGREYKAYDPRAAARLRFLDQENIHEDTYLGTGKWKNQYGEQVTGWNKGDQDRYFKSHSGLDRESDEYKDRFARKSNWGNTRTTGKDYAWYQ